MKIRWKELLFSLAISLGTGALAGLITRGGMEKYGQFQQPPLSPPGIVFPIVWTALYFLMGVSAYRVLVGEKPLREQAISIYAAQLAVNFFWPLFFFGWGWFWFSFFWLLLLLVLVVWMIFLFFKNYRLAGILQIPYLLWLVFAAYLNLGVALLN